MNRIGYANFDLLYRSNLCPEGFHKTLETLQVYAGMYGLSVIAKEGFSGYNRIVEEWRKETAELNGDIDYGMPEEDYLELVKEEARRSFREVFKR